MLGLLYPAGHRMYSLYDLLDNSVFVVCFFVLIESWLTFPAYPYGWFK